MPDISWAAISAYFVSRGRISEILERAVLRLLGTCIGVLLAAAAGPAILSTPLAVAMVGAVVGMLAIYGALTTRWSQAWLLFGLMFGLTLFDKLEHPSHVISAIATGRVAQAAVGILAAILVGGSSSLTVRRRWPAPVSPVPQAVVWSSEAFVRATLGGLAMMLIPWASVIFAMHGLAQGYVTIISALIFPLAMASQRAKPLMSRLFQRLAGSLAGAAVAGLLILVAYASPTLLLGGVALSVGVGRYIENRRGQIAHAGMQFVLTVLVALAADSHECAQIAPAVDRLYGVLSGIAWLAAIAMAWYLVIRPKWASTGVR